MGVVGVGVVLKVCEISCGPNLLAIGEGHDILLKKLDVVFTAFVFIPRLRPDLVLARLDRRRKGDRDRLWSRAVHCQLGAGNDDDVARAPPTATGLRWGANPEQHAKSEQGGAGQPFEQPS